MGSADRNKRVLYHNILVKRKHRYDAPQVAELWRINTRNYTYFGTMDAIIRYFGMYL